MGFSMFVSFFLEIRRLESLKASDNKAVDKFKNAQKNFNKR